MNDKQAPQKAIIIIPAYSHVNHRLLDALMAAGVPFKAEYEVSDLPRLRSSLISAAMGHAERVVMIDSDIVLTAAQIKFLAETPSVTEKQALVGMYPLRNRQYWSVRVSSADVINNAKEDVFPVLAAGLGVAAVHSATLRQVASELPTITDRESGLTWSPFCVPNVRRSLDSGRFEYLPDDLSFWDRVMAVGCKLVGSKQLVAQHCFTTPVQYPDLAPQPQADSPKPAKKKRSRKSKN